MAVKWKDFLWLLRCHGHQFYLQLTKAASPSNPWEEHTDASVLGLRGPVPSGERAQEPGYLSPQVVLLSLQLGLSPT